MKEADGRKVSLILPEKEVERKGDERRGYAIVMRVRFFTFQKKIR